MTPVPKGNRRQAQKTETRAMLLRSARALFKTLEYDQVTMRAVASHAGIGLGTIYKHFPNKRSLLAGAFFDDLTRLFKAVKGAVPGDQPFKRRFLWISEQFFGFYTDRPMLSRAYLSQFYFYDTQWLDRINAFDREYTACIAAWIRLAQDKGEIGPQKESHTLAMVLMANYFFVLSSGFLRDRINDPACLAGQLEKLVDQTLS